jgi:Arm DNA-binding domain
MHRIGPECARLARAGYCHPAARQNGVWLMKLTFDTIRAIAPVPPKTEIIVFDDDVPGFGVRASMSGSKVFVVQYSIGNKQRRMSLGKIEMLEVDTARQKAKQILTAVRMGRDPAGDKR